MLPATKKICVQAQYIQRVAHRTKRVFNNNVRVTFRTPSPDEKRGATQLIETEDRIRTETHELDKINTFFHWGLM